MNEPVGKTGLTAVLLLGLALVGLSALQTIAVLGLAGASSSPRGLRKMKGGAR